MKNGNGKRKNKRGLEDDEEVSISKKAMMPTKSAVAAVGIVRQPFCLSRSEMATGSSHERMSLLISAIRSTWGRREGYRAGWLEGCGG